MPHIERILAATDLNPEADFCMEAAGFLANSFGCEVTLLHVIPAIPGSPLSPAKLRERAEKQLEALRERFFRAVPIVNPITTFGSVFGRILEYAGQQEADMIVIGAGAKGPGERFQLSVIAEQIVRYASEPVWLVKHSTPFRVDHILCPVDYSKHSRRALSLAVTLAKTFNARITVLTVVETLSNIYPGQPLVIPEEQMAYTEKRKAEFDAFLHDTDLNGIVLKKIIREGEPYGQILEFASEQGCQLIIMGSEGRSRLPLMLLGSVAEKVVRELPCSAVTVKAPKG